MSLSRSKCWYSNDCLHFLKHAVPFEPIDGSTEKVNKINSEEKNIGSRHCVKHVINIIVSNLYVKQRCVFKHFIVINDILEVNARVFISNNQNGEDSRTAERQRESVCERQRVTKSEG
jgi:hypothetical protein